MSESLSQQNCTLFLYKILTIKIKCLIQIKYIKIINKQYHKDKFSSLIFVRLEKPFTNLAVPKSPILLPLFNYINLNNKNYI